MNLNLHQSDVNPLLWKKVRISGGIGLRPNFFSSGRIFWAELAQESWRDLAAVRTEQLRAQYTSGKRVCWCEIQTKWRSSVVGERFREAVLASPTRDRALIVYRLLVRLSL